MNEILCCKHKVEHGKSAVSFFILNLFMITTTFAVFLGNNCTTFNNPSAVSLWGFSEAPGDLSTNKVE